MYIRQFSKFSSTLIPDMRILICFVAFVAVITLAFAEIEIEVEDVGVRCACPRIYQPLCASNGRTYANPCEFQCELKRARYPELRIVKGGRCEESD